MPADSIKSYQSIPTNEHHASPKPLAHTTTTALGVIRAVAGAGLLIAPQLVCNLFRIPITPTTAMVARGFGTRDIVLGELLLTADKHAEDRKEVKRALWAGVATDAADVGVTALALATGQISRTGAGLFGGAAFAAMVLGLVGLKSLK